VPHLLGYQGWLITTLDNAILLEGFGATYGKVKDTHSYRDDLCGNVATFSILSIIRRVYGFVPTSIDHVCYNQSAINATWKEKTLSVFDKTKPDAGIIMVARSAISELQKFSTLKAFWVGSHVNKCVPPYSHQEELNSRTDTIADRAHTDPPDELKPRHDALHCPEQHILVVISHRKVASRLPLHISNMIHVPNLRTYTT
jgi:hypothetical protein